MTILDTDFLIGLERARSGAMALAAKLDASGVPLRIPAAAWVEYLHGVPLAKLPRVRTDVADRALFHPFGEAEALEAVHLQRELVEDGRPLAWHDLQVAATARALREPLVSNDRRFGAIPGLEVTRF